MFTDAEKVDIRRYCGYAVYGDVAVPAFGDRYFTSYGVLEFRMSHLSTEEEDIVRTKFLTILTNLESAIWTTSDNLDTDKAAVWTHNRNEQGDREKLYTSLRVKLCNYFGVPFAESSTSAAVRLVV